MHTGRSGTKSVPEQVGDLELDTLRFVIAYDDVTAGKHAMQLLQSITRNMQGAGDLRVLPWSFHLLADEEWQPLANDDAEKADLLIIATSELQMVSAVVLGWLEGAIGRMRGTDAAVLSLRSPDENPRGSGPAFHEVIRSVALQAGLTYFSTVMEFSHTEICQRMQQRADTVTPVLDKILHQPTSLRVSGENN